jgi:hypothetical protein
MKVSVTGSSRGLGKSIFDYFSNLGHDVTGYDSKTNLADYFVRKEIIKNSIDTNIFVSCAKPGFSQTELLYEWYEVYKDKKIFVSIGSEIVNLDFWGDDVHMMRYHTQKKSLQHAVNQLNSKNIILLNPKHLYDKQKYNYNKLREWCEQNFKDILNGL